jgi:hypothetical protein
VKVPKRWQEALVRRESESSTVAKAMQDKGLVERWWADRPGFTLVLSENGLALAERFRAEGVE